MKNTVKYLGILVDSDLSWQPQICHVKKKLSRGLGCLYKLRHFLPKKTLPSLYYSFIYSHIVYGIEVWSSANSSLLDGVSVIMNKALRAILFKEKKDPTLSLYTDHFLNLANIIEFSWMKIIFKFNLGHFPLHFKSVFKSLNHTHQTRFNSDRYKLVLPHFSLKNIRRSIFFKGIQIWNGLDSSYCNSSNFISFKSELKKMLLKRQCVT